LEQVENSESWLADFEALKKAVRHGVVWSWFKSNFNPVDEKGKRIKQLLATTITISSYIKYLCNAFAFYKVRRYDIQGKRYLASNDKYYLSDHSFKYAKLGTKNADYGRMIENIIAVELLRQGYELYAGILYKKEIDFVAIKRNEKLYIQVANSVDELSTFQREIDPLMKIKDNYPKMILARTHQEYRFLYMSCMNEKSTAASTFLKK